MDDGTKPEKRLEAGRDPVTGRFLPGVCPNPAGRPKTAHLSNAIREALAQPSTADPTITNAEAIARALVARALKGDTRAAAELADRSEGRAKQTIDITAVRARFEQLSPAELERYATTGELPEWFDRGERPALPAPNAKVVEAEGVGTASDRNETLVEELSAEYSSRAPKL